MCEITKTTCTKCIANPGLDLNLATKTCRCKFEERYRERILSNGKIECYPCLNCPYDLLIRAKLSEEWTKIELDFSQNVVPPAGAINNNADMCKKIFDDTTLSLFGSGYSCDVTAKKITIRLGQDAIFSPTSKLNARTNQLNIDTCGCTYDRQIPISETENAPVTLHASLLPSEPIDLCTTAKIQLSNLIGQGNRPKSVQIEYQVGNYYSQDDAIPRKTVLSDNLIALRNYLIGKTELSLEIPGGYFLENAIYYIDVKYRTYLGEFVYPVRIETAKAIPPDIFIFGNKTIYHIFEWESFEINLKLKHKGVCDYMTQNRYYFNWSQDILPSYSPMNETLLSESFIPTTGYLKFSPYSLLPDSTYLLRVTALHKDFQVNSTLNIILAVSSTKLIVDISGGDRSINPNEPLNLSAVLSQDSIFIIHSN